ncbi:MAG: hypothetical protein SGI72_15260 [Planctomycetota bacterium]|nr:hypothetical protein [Planctomycetota bacterium]
MKVFLALVLCACLAPLPFARADQECPNVKASQVAAHVQGADDSNQCSIGISIFGFEISVRFGACPLNQTITPAHQACNGAASPGNMCVLTGNLDVQLLKCECNFFGGSVIGLHLPGCDCQEAGTAGTVEDFKTASCYPEA